MIDLLALFVSHFPSVGTFSKEVLILVARRISIEIRHTNTHTHPCAGLRQQL